MVLPCAPSEALTLGDFHVLDELFRGAAGAVFKVRRKKNRQLCVLKERKFAELGRKRDILNEVALLERLDHPNVIKCYGHFWDHASGALYMVLEYADAGDLYSHVLQRRMKGEYYDEGTIWVMFYQLCLGLNHLHSNGVIHRDIKSLNIMMCKDGMVKIGDLGVSRQVGQETMMLQTFYGTPLYASPELCENKPYNEKTDIWSLGVVLYEIACLTPPFSGQNLIALADSIRHARYPAMPRNMFSESLTRMVAMLLQKSYQKRPSIKQILSWFKEPPVLLPKDTQSKFIDGQNEDERMQKMREDRRQKKEEYELLQKKLREQQRTKQKKAREEEEEEEAKKKGAEEYKSEVSSSRSARDLSGRIDSQVGEGEEMFFEQRMAGGMEDEVPRAAAKENRNSRANVSSAPWVPETELSTHQLHNNRQKIENDIKRKKLQLRNMKKLLTHADYYGREKGKKSNKHPLMKPTGSNPQKVDALEKNILELEMQLQGRHIHGNGNVSSSSNNNSNNNFNSNSNGNCNNTNDTRNVDTDKFFSVQKASTSHQPVIAIPDTPGDKVADGPPSNEREARLRKRLMERLARQQKMLYGGKVGREEGKAATRPVKSTSIHKKSCEKGINQIYVDKAAPRGAWGEHGLGLPGLAKEKDKNSAHSKLREKQEREKERERRAKEDRARRAREKEIWEQKAREKEEEERAREMAVKLNYTFKPPEAFGDETESEVEEEEQEEKREYRERREKGKEKNRKEGDSDYEEDGCSLSDDSIGDGKDARLTGRNPVQQQSPERRRVFAQRPVNLHAKSKPRQNGAHNLFKVYSPPRRSNLPGHQRGGGTGRMERPATAGVNSRPATSARKYNFLNQNWH